MRELSNLMLRRHRSRRKTRVCRDLSKDAIEFIPTSRRRGVCCETFLASRVSRVCAKHATREHETDVPQNSIANAICFDYKI